MSTPGPILILHLFRELHSHLLVLLHSLTPEDWRGQFFDPKDQRGRDRSKLTAEVLARRIIEWSGAPRPTSLRHDAAEAIVIGVWGVVEAGWLERLPAGILL
jgi:hypothetical protein